MTQSNKILWVSITLSIFVLFVWVYTLFHNYYPFVNSGVQAVIPTDKKEYHPCEVVGFHLEAHYDGYKYSEVNFQLENDPESEHYYFIVLGSFKSISQPGEFHIDDLNALIPCDLFDRSSTIQEGKHRIYVTITEPQNPSKPPLLFQSDWFEIRRKDVSTN